METVIHCMYMKSLPWLILLVFIFASISGVFAQTSNKAHYTICLYRENRKEGKWVKQSIFVDSLSCLKIANRSRAILDIKTNVGDTLNLKIYYGALGQEKWRDILLPVCGNDTVYIKSNFYTENYNPLSNRRPFFDVDGVVMDKRFGEKEFSDNEYFKDKDGKKITRIEIDKDDL